MWRVGEDNLLWIAVGRGQPQYMVGWRKEDKDKYKHKDKDNTWLEGLRPQTQKIFSDVYKN